MTISDPKSTLVDGLGVLNEQVLHKLDGLSDHDLRRPMTPTGTNLLGLVKHVASVELGYFSDVFGRPSGRELPWFADGAELNADMWAAADESREEIVELHRFSAAHTDATIEALPLDATGTSYSGRTVSLRWVLVHMIEDTVRHAGHADILRELIDSTSGQYAGDQNIPGQTADEWAAYRARIEDAARRAR